MGEFRNRVESEGLDWMSEKEVFELLNQLGARVSMGALRKHEVTGAYLGDVTEDEARDIFGLEALGARRRLILAIGV